MPVAAALPEGFKDGKLSLLQGGGGGRGGVEGESERQYGGDDRCHVVDSRTV